MNTDTRTRTRKSPAERQKELFSVGIDAFAERGIGRATHADIAERAKVSVPTVFNYFPNREVLVEMIIKHSVDTVRERIVSALMNYPNTEPRVVLLNEAIRLTKSHEQLVTIILECNASIRAETKYWLSAKQELIRLLMKRSHLTEWDAMVYLGTLAEACQKEILQPETLATESKNTFMTELFFKIDLMQANA